MIFPILNGILRFHKAPVTWALFFLNFIVLIVTFNPNNIGQYRITSILADDYFIRHQGLFYAQYIEHNPQHYDAASFTLVEKAKAGDKDKQEILGGLALRDKRFMDNAFEFNFRGDMVALAHWRKELSKIVEMQDSHPSYSMGLDFHNTSLTKWISYQFVHSGMMHFVGNMVFLLIFGSALEPILGAMAFLFVYLLSGMFAAGVFLYSSGMTSIPLIGASGAVSGIMTLFGLMFWSRPVRYIFFLFIPKKGYAGFIYLPGWITFVMWMLSDLAGYLGTMKQFGGVAHSAHLGGELAGLIVAIVVFAFRKYKNEDMIPAEKLPPTKPMWTKVA